MMATNRTLLEQARELQALAQTGLMYCKDPFDRERYERIRAMAVDMLSTQVDAPAGQVSRLLSAGYPTPKLDTRAAIFDEEGRILMTHENSGEWSLPGGWVDENQSIRSNAVKEVKEETGLDVRGERLRGAGLRQSQRADLSVRGAQVLRIVQPRRRLVLGQHRNDGNPLLRGRPVAAAFGNKKHRGTNRHVFCGPPRSRLDDAI